MNIVLHKKAEKKLRYFQKKENTLFLSLMMALNELEDKNILASQLKSLSGLENGFRKRVGRCRILFTVHYEKDELKIWIIDIEKDTQKDYKKWLSFIHEQLN